MKLCVHCNVQIADNSTHFLEELTNIRNNFEVCDDFVFFFNEVCLYVLD